MAMACLAPHAPVQAKMQRHCAQEGQTTPADANAKKDTMVWDPTPLPALPARSAALMLRNTELTAFLAARVILSRVSVTLATMEMG